MIYSKTCEYAIRALAFAAQKGPSASVTVDEVSRATRAPKAYVAKIFQGLVKEKILSSRRGPKGGFSLAIAPSKLTVLRVVEAVEDPSQSFFSGCLMGLKACGDHSPCSLHSIWSGTKGKMVKKLSRCTLSDRVKIGGKFKADKGRRFTLYKKMRDVFHTV